MKYNIFSLIIIVLFFTNCYDDKGSNSYHDINTIEIGEFPNFENNITIGDVLDIKPELTFSSGVETENLTYTWTYCGKTRPEWNKKDFHWVTDTIALGQLALRITDPNTGVTYIQSKTYEVYSKFNAYGWIILGDKDQKSYLTFIKESIEENETGEEVWADIVYEDVYKQQNNSELGSIPIKIHEHFCNTYGNSNLVGNIMIVQQGGQGMVDLDGFAFQKEITIDEAFANNALPADFKPINTMSMKRVDLIENYDGKIFSRVKPNDQLFHSSSYLQTPVTLDGEELHAHIHLSTFVYCGFATLHDFENNRLDLVLDQTINNGLTNVNKPLVMPGKPSDDIESVPADWVPLDNLGDNELIHLGYYRPDPYDAYSSQCVGFFMILKDKDGKYWTQDFIINRDWNISDVYLNNCKRNEIDLAPYINSNSVIYTLPYGEESDYVLISKDKELYLYCRNSPKDGIKPYYTCSGNVTAINAEKYRHRHAGIGMDNGQFIILNMKDGKNLTNEEKLIWKTPEETNLGKIVDVRFKVGSGNEWSWSNANKK